MAFTLSTVLPSNDTGLRWRIVTGNTTLLNQHGYLVDTSSAAITLTLPASPSEGDCIGICDYKNNCATNNITLARNSTNIEGNAEDFVIDINGAGIHIVYTDAARGWEIVSEVGSGETVANSVQTDVTNFAGILDSADSDIQAALDTIDDHTHAHDVLTGLADDDHSQYYNAARLTTYMASPDEIGGTTPGVVNATRVDSSQIKATDANGLLLTDDGDNGIFVEDGGNVGIGTTSPDDKFQANRDSYILTNTITFWRGAAISGIYGRNMDITLDDDFVRDNYSNVGVLGVASSDGSAIGLAGYGLSMSSRSAIGAILGATNTSATTGSAIGLFIKKIDASAGTDYEYSIYDESGAKTYLSGNVGIGTTSPDAKLHVSGGNIKVDSTYGIDFSGTSDATGMSSEVLDDYEEGTWTATMEPGSGFTPTSNTRTGYYTKIGNVVNIVVRAQMTTPASLGTYVNDHTGYHINISGLPFLSKNVSGLNHPITVGLSGNLISVNGFLIATMNPGSSAIQVFVSKDDGSTRTSPTLNVSSDIYVALQATYITA